MFHARSVVLACFSAFSIVACSHAGTMNNFTAQPSGGMFSNADVADIVLTANSAEVQQSELALTKGVSPAVRDFAQRMIIDHSDAIRNTASLVGSPVETNVVSNNLGSMNEVLHAVTYTPLRTTPLSSKLADGSDQTMTALTSLSGTQFDQQYIATQIAEHQWLLDTLDASLIPSARGEALRSQLQSMRDQVENHLALARSVQQSIGQ
jgi:putative membrane protein